MATVHERIARAREALVAVGIAPGDAALDAELLARHVLGWDGARLLAEGREDSPADFQAAYDRAIGRRHEREPVSHITGHREFWGLDFEVTPDVLTPRPETELIVEEALALFAESKPRLIADVGTGSGCLAVALALEFPAAELIATDVSMAALGVARRNAARHGVDGRITFLQADLLPSVPRIDLIVSNPPYIAASDAESLPPEVRDHEPHLALFGGADGLSVYRRLLPEAWRQAGEEGRLIVEVGYDQARAVTDLASASGWMLVRARQDLQDITRTLVFESAEPDAAERS
jgi:release factor glutamine methyltransferase